MGYLVPRAKIGVFSEMSRAWHDANPNATPEQRADAMTKAWDNVEDRLGQMTYDNLFWDKTTKDLAFVAFRSVGWNLGTVRSGAGAVIDTGRFLADAARLRRPEFTGRMAYGIAQFVNTAMLGAALTYAFTGQGPQTWLDYFFPRTGGTSGANGGDERLSIPGYVKDWIEWSRDPAQTLANKVHPLISLGSQIANNRNYYGHSIYDPIRDEDSMAAAYGDFIINSFRPFTISGYEKLKHDQASDAAKAMSLMGYQPAPKSITEPERGKRYQQAKDRRDYRNRAKEPDTWHILRGNPASSPPP
jgi:hypothetical protein